MSEIREMQTYLSRTTDSIVWTQIASIDFLISSTMVKENPRVFLWMRAAHYRPAAPQRGLWNSNMIWSPSMRQGGLQLNAGPSCNVWTFVILQDCILQHSFRWFKIHRGPGPATHFSAPVEQLQFNCIWNKRILTTYSPPEFSPTFETKPTLKKIKNCLYKLHGSYRSGRVKFMDFQGYISGNSRTKGQKRGHEMINDYNEPLSTMLHVVIWQTNNIITSCWRVCYDPVENTYCWQTV
jgi:hypothetical protein